MKRSTSTQDWNIEKAIKEQLPQYPRTHSMESSDVVHNFDIKTLGEDAIFLGLTSSTSEWYDPDKEMLVQKSQNGSRRATGYKLKVDL